MSSLGEPMLGLEKQKLLEKVDTEATKAALLNNADSNWPMKVAWGPPSFAGMQVYKVTLVVWT